MGRGLRILGFWFGRAGVAAGGWGASVAQRFMPRHGHAGRCPDPPRNLRFLGTSICCRPFGRRALRTRTQAQAATTAAQRRRLAPTPPQKRTPAGKRRPPARGPRRLCAAAAARGLRPPAAPSDDGHCEPERRRKPRPPRRSAVISHQAYTRNVSQRASADHRRVDRVAHARQQLAAGTARHLTNWGLVGKIGVGGFSIFLSGGMIFYEATHQYLLRSVR